MSRSNPKPRVECRWYGCDAWATARGLCRIHYSVWPFQMYLTGSAIEERRVNRDGYVEACVNGVWALEHRLIMTKKLGRMLRHDEIIVHDDGNNTNNDEANLILTTRAEPMRRRKIRLENP